MLDAAVDIIREHPEYLKDIGDEKNFFGRIILPHRSGHMVLITEDDGTRLVFTWTRIDQPFMTVPDERHWSNDGDMLWLCDMVYDQGMTAMRARDLAQEYVLGHGIGEDGERFYYWRGKSKRFGVSILRGKANV
jgi:hypothetical protein